MSYDVKALFTSVPIQPATDIIKQHLEEDRELQQRTSLTVSHITCLLEFYLKTTYFTFQGRYYEQLDGSVMGSTISTIVANLIMEYFEVKSHQHITTPSSLCKRYIDDAFTVIISTHKRSFLDHINSLDPNIQFAKRFRDRWIHGLLGHTGDT